jgi:hypothetical protein
VLRYSLLALVLVGCANEQFTAVQAADASVEGGTDADGGAPPPPAAEDCLDGQDNNSDGKMDCAEPTCAPYARCVGEPSALPGWTGYTTLVTNGACPAEIPGAAEVWVADERSATCAACRCDATGNCSTSVSVAESIAAGCTTVTPFTVDSAGGCQSVPAGAGGNGAFWQMANPGGGLCVAAPVTPPSLPAAHHAAIACSAARLGGGCAPGQGCAKLGAPGLCVSRAAGSGPPAACPAQFPIAHMVVPRTADPATSFVDRRGCSSCGCAGAPTGGGCTATLSLYSDTTCGTLKGTVKSGACNPLSCGTACKGAKVAIQYAPGTCTANGGAPTGVVELATAGTQYCCEQ